MDFINKIGQRNFAKILVLLAFCTCFLGFLFENTTNLRNVAFGLFLFILPNAILSMTASKNKDYRLFSLAASFVLLVFNNLLFFLTLKLILFLVLIIQIVATSVFYFFVNNLEKKKKLDYKKRKLKLKVSGKTLNKETTLDQDTEIMNNV